MKRFTIVFVDGSREAVDPPDAVWVWTQASFVEVMHPYGVGGLVRRRSIPLERVAEVIEEPTEQMLLDAEKADGRTRS